MASAVLNNDLDLIAFVALMAGMLAGAHFWLRRRTGRAGLHWRSHVAFALLTLAGVLLAAFSGHSERERLRNSVSNLAPTYADELTRMGHEKVTVHTAADDPGYLAMIETEKRWLKANINVADIYTFGRNDAGQVVLLVDSETDYDHNGVYAGEREQRTAIGEVYDEDPKEIARAFAGQSVWMNTPTADRWGTWVSCFVPMRNVDGKVFAVLGVDYPADDWVQQILLHRAGALLLAAIVGLMVVAGQATSRLGRSETRALEVQALGEMGLRTVEVQPEGWRESLHAGRPIGIVVAVALAATLLARFLVLRDGMTVARHQFDTEWHEQLERTQARVDNTFALTYDALRTIASLPGVQRIERHAEGFEGDSKLTVQSLYNNIASHVAVSEIYIVPADLDPDAIDPSTGKPAAPITTFDQIIVGRNADQADEHDKEDGGDDHLEEVEIYEYRQMKRQIAEFRERYPTRASFQGLDYPAASSEEVITCDNTEFSKHELEDHNDAPRMGIVYSVPFYGPAGEFRGMISAVIRTRALARLLPGPEFTLQRDNPGYVVHTLQTASDDGRKPALELQDAAQWHDASTWLLHCTVPQSALESHPMVAAAVARASLATYAGIGISLPLAGLMWSLMATRRRAMRLADKMTVELRRTEARVKAIIDGALDAVVKCNADGLVVTWNPQAAVIFGWQEAEVLSRPLFATLFSARQPDDAKRELLGQLVSGETQFVGRVELLAINKSGETFPAEVAIAPIANEGSRCAFIRDISELKKAEGERERLHAELLDASRSAGMAEIATGVLHNVGNALNSVNLAASVIAERVKSPEVAELAEASGLIETHKSNLAAYFTEDNAGKHVPEYVAALAHCVARQHQELDNELRQLTHGIEHIKEIVRTQQQFAKSGPVAQELPAEEIVQAALDLNAGVAAGIEVVREINVRGRVRVDKHRILQILVNLIKNARQALLESEGPVRRITIRVSADRAEGRTVWQVKDTGPGIAPANLQRIFQHGFTTKKEGHGFGLHSCSNAAVEMGGTLKVDSEGLGKGATFTLEIPDGTHQEMNT